MTDNAWAYKWSLRQVVADLGARQIFIRRYCPWQNGKVERFNRTLQTEWAYRQAFTNNADRTAALAPWLEHYNTVRRARAAHSEDDHHQPACYQPMDRYASRSSTCRASAGDAGPS